MYKPKYYSKYAKSLYQGAKVGAAVAGAINKYKKYKSAAQPRKQYRKYNKPNVKPKRKTVKGQIRELKRLAESNMGTHIQRRRATAAYTSAVAQMSLNSFSLSNLTLLEEVLAQLRYYNPSLPGTLTNADGTSGTFQKEFYFHSVYHRVRFVNNYQVPARVKIYLVRSKKDTSISASTAFTNGLADVGNPSSTSPLIHLTDSVQFTDLYNIIESKSMLLQPGQECVLNHTDKGFQYDPSMADSHALAYQRKYYDMQCVVRIEGLLGHDSAVATEQTNLQAGLDMESLTTFVVKYDAGADIKYIYIDDEADVGFTNGGLVSSKPVSDNIAYSLS